jgi:hypothetical protein
MVEPYPIYDGIPLEAEIINAILLNLAVRSQAGDRVARSEILSWERNKNPTRNSRRCPGTLFLSWKLS